MEESVIQNKAVIDPVCGMEVDPHRMGLVVKHKKGNYYFCAEKCRRAFEANPWRYLCGKPGRCKGLWGRYVERLNRATGGKPLKCH